MIKCDEIGGRSALSTFSCEQRRGVKKQEWLVKGEGGAYGGDHHRNFSLLLLQGHLPVQNFSGPMLVLSRGCRAEGLYDIQ